MAAKNAIFKGDQKQLRKDIKQSKVRCWVELCREVDMVPWGLGYKIVTQILGLFGPPELLDALTTERVIEELFPIQPPRSELTTCRYMRFFFSLRRSLSWLPKA